jgi:ketosteroid isomerase-like protein
VVSQESTTPDLVELTRQSMEATNRGDLSERATLFAPDAVFDVSSAGLGRFEGRDAVHAYLADWIGSYDRQEMRQWEGWDLGNGVVFVVTTFDSQPRGSQASVRERWAFSVLWEDGMISCVIANGDIAEARASAEQLVQERC